MNYLRLRRAVLAVLFVLLPGVAGLMKVMGQGSAPEGALPGFFSVGENTVVNFSQGNLQYKASTNTWRFAESQWDYVGTQTPGWGDPGGTVPQSDNSNISQNYNGWIALFGWGTSGWDNGNVYYQPWSTDFVSDWSTGYGYGPTDGSNYEYDLTGAYANADWGSNAIINGGNQENSGWRTLTQPEWYYVFNIRTMVNGGPRYTLGRRVEGVLGVVVYPDNYAGSAVSSDLTAEGWAEYEAAGCAFLPAAGRRNGTSVSDVGSYGIYWSASCGDTYGAWGVYFDDSDLYTDYNGRYYGQSVRLVRSAQNYSFTINATPNPAEGGAVSGAGAYAEGAECTLTATASAGYTFVNWTENGEEVSTEATYSFTVTGDRELVAHFSTIEENLEILLFEPFDEYIVGNKIAYEAITHGHNWWTTWSNAPGGGEDGVVANIGDGSCGHFVYGNDQVLLLGNEENGKYDIEFDILVPEGKNGYFNILHHFAGSNSTWAMQCYLHLTNDGQNSTAAPGHGTVHAGSYATADVACVYDAWMHFRLNVDTDTDVARYYYTAPGQEEVLVCEWKWSLDSFGNSTVGRTLGAMDFFPPYDAATSEFYIDNISFKKNYNYENPNIISHGTLNGLFSVSDSQQVYFSQGNLQYIGSAGNGDENNTGAYWKFAVHQWNYLGYNGQGSDSKTVNRDLFGWGTSGWNNGNVYYQPWSTDYVDDWSTGYGYGPTDGSNYEYDLTGAYANADWGSNAIINGGNQENSGWRTLTRDEWDYVFNTRTMVNGGPRYTLGRRVEGVLGVIVYPDNYAGSAVSSDLTAEGWAEYEAAGCVFLPAAGRRYGTSVNIVGSYGNYWSASYNNTDNAWGVLFNDSSLYTDYSNYRNDGRSVRLVRSAQNYSFTINATPNPAEGGAVSGGGAYAEGAECALTATASAGYTFVNWTENGEVVSTDPTYLFTVTGDRELVANFSASVDAVQEIHLTTGWNWISSFVDYRPQSLVEMMNAIASESETAVIKSQDYFISYGAEEWAGTLSSLDNSQMYLVLVNHDMPLTFSGSLSDPAAHPVELKPGWNWIGYPVNTPMPLKEALSGIQPTQFDLVKGQENFSSYDTLQGGWTGSLDTLEPGQGYLYLSTSTDTLSFTFPESTPVMEGTVEIPVGMDASNIVVTNFSEEVVPDEEGNFEIKFGNMLMAEDLLTGEVIYTSVVSVDYEGLGSRRGAVLNSVELNSKETAIALALQTLPYGLMQSKDETFNSIKEVLYSLDCVKDLESAIETVVSQYGYLNMDELGTAMLAVSNFFMEELFPEGIRDHGGTDTVPIVGKIELGRDGNIRLNPPFLPISRYSGIRIDLESANYNVLSDTWSLNMTAYSDNGIYIGILNGYADENGFLYIGGDRTRYFVPPMNVGKFMGTFVTWSGLKSYFRDLKRLITEEGFGFDDATWDMAELENIRIDIGVDDNVLVFLSPWDSQRTAIVNAVYFVLGSINCWVSTEGIMEYFMDLFMDEEFLLLFANNWNQGDEGFKVIAAKIIEKFEDFITTHTFQLIVQQAKIEKVLEKTLSLVNFGTFVVCTAAALNLYETFGLEIVAEFSDDIVLPGLITNSFEVLSSTEAVVTGALINEGNEGIVERGICYSASPNPTINDYCVPAEGTGIGAFTCNLQGLEIGHQYYVRSYAKNNYGMAGYGNELNFSTLSGIPIITTYPVNEEDITTNSAVLRASVEGVASSSIWMRGFFYSTSPQVYYEDPSVLSVDAMGGGTGEFTATVTGLEEGVPYYYVPYIVTDQEEVYQGAEMSFTTLSNGGNTGDSIVITAVPNPEEGGTVSGAGTYAAGTECTLTATASTGYTFVNWTENGEVVSTDPTYLFTVTGDRTLVANFVSNGTNVTDGVLNGLFSVGAGRQVYFSQGNLQYIGSAGNGDENNTGAYWKFAEHQWDFLGDNGQGSDSKTVNRDLFGWGTSGWNNRNVYYQPWSIGYVNDWTQGFGYGPTDGIFYEYDLTGAYANADWGFYNPIVNGGNCAGLWRTMMSAEWDYVFCFRNTPSGIRFAKACVNNVNGVILLPDNWNNLYYPLNKTNIHTANYNSNSITASQWATLEQHGAVFLPAAGSRNGTSVSDVGSTGLYWSASSDYMGGGVLGSGLGESFILFDEPCYPYAGFSVRLVRSFEGSSNVSDGVLNGLFSVGENTAVRFSQGNLQYKASANTWRFAENQYDCIGSANSNISSTYNDYIDLFGWGTSGYNHGANCYQPWSTSVSESDYYAYGNPTYHLYDRTGNADWGYNAIINGGNQENIGWRTLTHDEWDYLFNTRTTSSGIRYAKAIVNNVNGVILLPNDWNSSYYALGNTNISGASYSSNTISSTQWTTLEQHGAVFLPAAADRDGTFGFYWSATVSSASSAWCMKFGNSDLSTDHHYLRFYRYSVRLVRSAQNIAINAVSNPVEGGAVSGAGVYAEGAECTLTAKASAGYHFVNWTENGEVVSTVAIYSFTVTGNRTLVAHFVSTGTGFTDGALNGVFSVGENISVRFSQGNLQYVGSAGNGDANNTGAYWKFAEHQWESLGDNGQGSDSKTVDRDLFCWGTSGYNHGANCYQPWSTSMSESDYYVYGNSNYNLFDLTGLADWGYNAINNGVNQVLSGWRTLTHDEWEYLFNTRNTSSGIRYAMATVNDIKGVILLPDDWQSSYYSLSSTNINASFSSNTITAVQWATLEEHGAVFLPAAGDRFETSVSGVGSSGGYWSASCEDSNHAWSVDFYDGNLTTYSSYYRCAGLSVRLVRSF